MNKRYLSLVIAILLPSLLLFGCGSVSKVYGMDKDIYKQGKEYAQMMKDAMNGNTEKYESERENFKKFIDKKFTKDDENLYLLIHTLTSMSIFVTDHNVFGGDNGKDGFEEAEKLLKEKLNIELK